MRYVPFWPSHELAAIEWTKAHKAPGPGEVEALQKRVETLETRLEQVMKRVERVGIDKR